MRPLPLDSVDLNRLSEFINGLAELCEVTNVDVSEVQVYMYGDELGTVDLDPELGYIFRVLTTD